jgi:hypothetical protein
MKPDIDKMSFYLFMGVIGLAAVLGFVAMIVSFFE